MKVINQTDATLAIEGIYIPAGQHRNVRPLDGLDELPERVQARLEAGDISIPGLDDGLATVSGADEYFGQPVDEPSETALSRARGFFSRDSDDDEA